MSISKIIISIATIALAACGTTSEVTDGVTKERTEPGEENIEVSADSDFIWVNSFKSDCGGAAPLIYYLQTQEGTAEPVDNWDCFRGDILGLEYEPGYIYQLEVTKEVIQGRPVLSVLEVISKERDPKYFRIYDIWALTHMNEEVLEISDNRPTIEINLSTFTALGNALCNQYSTSLNSYTATKINFGPIASTEMMCPNIAMEQQYLEALSKVNSYDISSMTLRFYDNTHKEILRFQKID